MSKKKKKIWDRSQPVETDWACPHCHPDSPFFLKYPHSLLWHCDKHEEECFNNIK